MEIREMTALDMATMAQMVLSLIRGKGMEESIANQVISNIKEEYQQSLPILW